MSLVNRQVHGLFVVLSAIAICGQVAFADVAASQEGAGPASATGRPPDAMIAPVRRIQPGKAAAEARQRAKAAAKAPDPGAAKSAATGNAKAVKGRIAGTKPAR